MSNKTPKPPPTREQKILYISWVLRRQADDQTVNDLWIAMMKYSREWNRSLSENLAALFKSMDDFPEDFIRPESEMGDKAIEEIKNLPLKKR